MPKCRVCDETYYLQSYTEPSEPCNCGEEFGYNLWYNSHSWSEYFRLIHLQWRWWTAKKLWALAEWATPEV